MRSLVLDNTARKTFDSLPDKHFRQVITAVFSLLKEPLPQDTRPLTGVPCYRITVGKYRVVYDFDDERIRVLAFGKRNDGEVYRRLGRLP